MSWLSKQFKSAKKIVSKNARGLGRTVEKYGAPVAAGALALTGAGLPASMAIMGATKAGGSLLAGRNLKNTLKQGVTGAGQGALTFGAGKVLGGLAGKVGAGAGEAAGSAASTASKASGLTLPTGAKMAADGTLQAARTMAVPSLGNGATAARGGLAKILSGAGRMVKENPLVVAQVAGGVLDAKMQSDQNALMRKQMEEEERRRRQLSELYAPLIPSAIEGYGRYQAPTFTPWNPNFGGR